MLDELSATPKLKSVNGTQNLLEIMLVSGIVLMGMHMSSLETFIKSGDNVIIWHEGWFFLSPTGIKKRTPDYKNTSKYIKNYCTLLFIISMMPRKLEQRLLNKFSILFSVDFCTLACRLALYYALSTFKYYVQKKNSY